MYEQFKFLHLLLYCGLMYWHGSFKLLLLQQVCVYKINSCRFYNRLGDAESFHTRLPVYHKTVLIVSIVAGMKPVHLGCRDIFSGIYEPFK